MLKRNIKYAIRIVLVILLVLVGCKQKVQSSVYESEYQALRNGDEKMFVDRLKDIRDINATYGSRNDTLLVVASIFGRQEAVRALIRDGADVNRLCKQQQDTPLIVASLNGHFAVVELLVQAGADVNKPSVWGYTPLMGAAGTDSKIVDYLLEHGANVNAREIAQGYTPLIFACLNRSEADVRILIEHGADVDVTDKQGRSPLMIACLMNDIKIVSLLLDHGANKNAISNDGRSARSIAQGEGFLDIVKLLDKK